MDLIVIEIRMIGRVLLAEAQAVASRRISFFALFYGRRE